MSISNLQTNQPVKSITPSASSSEVDASTIDVSLEDATAYQDEILPQVSRTFALTIPELPEGLRGAVGNAYLLCRIADTIEDEPALSTEDKARFHQRFIAAIAGKECPRSFARDLVPLLTGSTLEAEKALVDKTDHVLRYTHSLDPQQQSALQRCVSIMCSGMGDYQRTASLSGLAEMRDLDHYCYFVAGVVGEMLTELFCHYLDGSKRLKDTMMGLATSFGQGLQMTNILKDVWDDHERGVCWWPREIFSAHGIDLEKLDGELDADHFAQALGKMVGVAHGHLANALKYTLMIPRNQTGIRRFCLWAIGLAVMTLKNIHRRPSYRSGQEVKVSRKRLASMIATINISERSNWALNMLFKWAGRGVPLSAVDESTLPSCWSTVEAIPVRSSAKS